MTNAQRAAALKAKIARLNEERNAIPVKLGRLDERHHLAEQLDELYDRLEDIEKRLALAEELRAMGKR